MTSLLKITLLVLSMVMITTHAAMGALFGHESGQRENTDVGKLAKLAKVGKIRKMDAKTFQRQADGDVGINKSCSRHEDCKKYLHCESQGAWGYKCRPGVGK